MDIFEILHAEHENLAHLFSRLESLSPDAVDVRGRTFSQLKHALSLHSRAEEQVFYPALDQHAHSGVLEAAEEHHVLDLLLDELSAMDNSSEHWLAKLKVLRENMAHHVEEEEGELFAKARDLMSAEDAALLGERFNEAKRNLH
jgi:iron-sulfur cluster repair protein YtfE (RIC family)